MDSITLNGARHPLEGSLSVAELLDTLGLARKPVVVELNGEALTSADHATTRVVPGARLEIITLAAGG
ncbi:MAG: sulfur carrier protein ThiS [Akkermansiaceae bacterium]|nr:sulfur carrier protein ThiS [Akkermansiaceae bacterium]